MTGTRISDMDIISSLAASGDDVPVVRAGVNYRFDLGAKFAALLGATGGELVGFQADGAGAVLRSLQGKAEETISVLDFIPVAYHAAIKDGSTTQDVTAYIEAALTAIPVGTLHFPAGTYRHTGLTINTNVSLVGDGMMNTFLKNSASGTPSIAIQFSALIGSILQAGLYDFTVLTVAPGDSDQHGIVIDGASSGYMVERVRATAHGGDGFRIKAGNTGPMFSNIVSTLNAGWGVNITSIDEDPGAIPGNASTSGRFHFFAVTGNTLGGIRINGGDTQDTTFYYFDTGVVESNGAAAAGTCGILLLNGVGGPSFRNIWLEDNNDYGILCQTDGAGAGQVPFFAMFDNIYIAEHDTYAIRVEAGQSFSWKDVFVFGAGTEAFFVDGSNADSHMILGNFPTLNAGGLGRNVRRLYGSVGEAFWRLTPSILTNTVFLGTATHGIFSGTGSPEGVVAAAVGSHFHRTDGGTGTSFYVKETGAATSAGWVAK